MQFDLITDEMTEFLQLVEQPVVFGPRNIAIDRFDKRFGLFFVIKDGFAMFDDFLTTTFGQPIFRLELLSFSFETFFHF